MNFKQWLFLEVPIGNFDLLGNWGPKANKYGYKSDDIGILTSPKAVAKIKRQWFKTEYRFDFYFLRSAVGRQYQGVGEVDEDYLKNTLQIDLQPNPDAITVIFTNNTGDERMPMTGWTMAHRFGHVIRRTQSWTYFHNEFMLEWRKVLDEVYGLKIKYRATYSGTGIDKKYYPYADINKDISNRYGKDAESIIALLATALGTMRSARQNQLRNLYEFQYELLAQYLLTGKIKFNPLPAQLITRYAWGRPSNMVRSQISPQELADWNDTLSNMVDQFEYILDSTVHSMVGKIFVM